jgi:hypothetical protein
MDARSDLWRAELLWGSAIGKRLMTSHKELKTTWWVDATCSRLAERIEDGFSKKREEQRHDEGQDGVLYRKRAALLLKDCCRVRLSRDGGEGSLR